MVTVSDDEEEPKESKESKDAANSSAQKITESLQLLGDSLKTLSANADELMLVEQQASKRQQVEPPDAAGTKLAPDPVTGAQDGGSHFG